MLKLDDTNGIIQMRFVDFYCYLSNLDDDKDKVYLALKYCFDTKIKIKEAPII